MNTNEKVIDTICHIRHCGDRYDMCQDMRSWVAERNGLIQDLLKAKNKLIAIVSLNVWIVRKKTSVTLSQK